jgi:hypothetical protein
MDEHERGVHDVGGLPGPGIDRHEHALTLFQQRVDAILMLLISPKVGAFKVDALRRVIESNSPEDYATLGYYERWIRAVRTLLVEQEVLTDAEIEARIADVRARLAAEGTPGAAHV